MRANAPLFILVFFAILPLYNLLTPGLPVTHDGQDHVARIANFYSNLAVGNIIPRWAENLNWGYGHPVLMFLYPLPSYSASFFHALGFSFVDSFKIILALFLVLSGYTMFLWVRSFTNSWAGLVAGVMYMYSPYRFVDLYVRGAIGEHAAFIFPPLILFFLLQMSKSKSSMYTVATALSVAMFILSHNAISLMFMPLFLLYSFYLWVNDKTKIQFVLKLLMAFIIGFGIAAFFWIPAFAEGSYTLRDIVTSNEYKDRFESISRFIYSPWSYGESGNFSVQVGLAQWASISLVPFVVYKFYRTKDSRIYVAGSLFVIFVLTLFIMHELSRPIWDFVTILQKFQFPWRFLNVVAFTTSVIGGLIVFAFSKRTVMLSLIFILLATVPTVSFWKAKSYIERPESFYSGIYEGTTDTGESSPLWSVRFMEQFPAAPAEIIEGEGSISMKERKPNKHLYTIDLKTPSRILENTLYFPGWVVYVDDVPADLEFQDPAYRGLMTFNAQQGSHNVKVLFEETKLRKISNLVSSVSILLIFLYTVYYIGKKLWLRYQ